MQVFIFYIVWHLSVQGLKKFVETPEVITFITIMLQS